MMADDVFRDPRRGKNTQHDLTTTLRQAVYSRLSGYEDTNDAERLSVDPAGARMEADERIPLPLELTGSLAG